MRRSGLRNSSWSLGRASTRTRLTYPSLSREKAEEGAELNRRLNDIALLTADHQKNEAERTALTAQIAELEAENDKIVKRIEELKTEKAALDQRVELNEILKDFDIDEIKAVRQNNLAVSSGILNLVSKWNSLEGKQ